MLPRTIGLMILRGVYSILTALYNIIAVFLWGRWESESK